MKAPPIAVSLALLIACTGAAAAPFELAVAPSRFELSAKPGARTGQSLDIHNLASAPTEVAMRTIDWTYSDTGDITYHDELLPGSCRPWVLLERRSVTIAGRSKKAFRFQVEPPADAPRGECRFMIAIEGVEPAQQTVIQSGGASLSLPVTGRIAIAVYVALNGAAPTFEIKAVGMREGARGARTPSVTVTNTGDAHGRLDGGLDATDSQGKAYELVPEGTPVMPGPTRTLTLAPRADDTGKAPAPPTYPLKASGLLDWERGSFKVNAEFK